MSRFPLRLPQRPHKVSTGIVALSSSAILAIYAAGYSQTRFPEDERDLELLAKLAQSTPAAAAAAATAVPAVNSPPPATPGTPRPTPPALAVPSPYRDGEYVGVGRAKHGSIEVTVQVRGGLIVAAEITDCMMRYPCERVETLPGQVVQIQGVRVDKVTGATESTFAYVRAVAEALEKAAS